MKLSEFIELLEQKRKEIERATGEKDPYIEVGTQSNNKGVTISNFEIVISESLGDRFIEEIHIISKI